ncbi:MAG: acyl carrier protein [Aphanocapsa sp. GSE-SYN-MK-11-07L]|nr:acyl carrier protein [Aphanocapsa sp. GSE-SYN-MK-11-07L]
MSDVYANELTSMNTLKAILVDLGIPGELLHPDTLLHQDLRLDSTEIVEVSLGLKRRLGISMKLEGRQDLTLVQVCDQVEAALLASRSKQV